MAYLDFERPYIELEEKISAYAEFCRSHGLDTTVAQELMDERIGALCKKIFKAMSPWEKVQVARHGQRPHPEDLAKLIFTDYLELHGDRYFQDDRAIVGGFARFNGREIMLIMTRKGRNLVQNIEANFGCAQPEGYRKALRLMRLAEKARMPIVCLVDTPGAYPGIGAEERHIGEAIAENLREMFRLTVPIVSVITGEGGSGGALGLAVANRLLILECAYFSVITPEGCAAILWRSEAETARAAAALKLTSQDLLDLGVADAVVREATGGAHRDWNRTAEYLKQALKRQFAELDGMSPDALQVSRYAKFRALGKFIENAEEDEAVIRPARECEVKAIYEFFQPFVAKEQILPRSQDEIRRNLGNFLLAIDNDGAIIGTVALRDFDDGLAEIRSLAVASSCEGKGTGSRLVNAIVECAVARGIHKIFTLTTKPKLFHRLGFTQVSIMRFPDKVQADCLKCPKKEHCDEVALVLNR